MIGHGYPVVEAARPDGTAPTLLGKSSPGAGRGGARPIPRRRRRPTYAKLAATLALVLRAAPPR